MDQKMAERNIYLNPFAFILHLSLYIICKNTKKPWKILENWNGVNNFNNKSVLKFKCLIYLKNYKVSSLNSRKMHELKK